MKRVLGLLFFMAFAITSFAQQPAIEFESESHDFGEIEEGVQATYEFKFTNTGDEPLIISNVRAACGCTTPSWPREPIMPGETGTIKAVYNSQGRPGRFHKSVTVTTNMKENGTKVLYLRGDVKPKGEVTPADKSPVQIDPDKK